VTVSAIAVTIACAPPSVGVARRARPSTSAVAVDDQHVDLRPA